MQVLKQQDVQILFSLLVEEQDRWIHNNQQLLYYGDTLIN
jgi:hypothetical protein